MSYPFGSFNTFLRQARAILAKQSSEKRSIKVNDPLRLALLGSVIDRFPQCHVQGQRVTLDKEGYDAHGHHIGMVATTPASIKQLCAGIDLEITAGGKTMNLADIYANHPGRITFDTLVFCPNGAVGQHMLNLWRGLLIVPAAGPDIQLVVGILLESLGNDGVVCEFLRRFLGDALSPINPMPGAAIELQGGDGHPVVEALVDGMKRILGPHCLDIRAVNHLEHFQERLTPPTLVFIRQPVLDAAPRKVAAFLDAVLCGDEIELKPKGCKPFKVPNHAHVVILSSEPYEASKAVAKRLCSIEMAGVDAGLAEMFRQEMGNQAILAAVAHHLIDLAQADRDFSRIPLTQAMACQRMTADPALCFLEHCVERGELAVGYPLVDEPENPVPALTFRKAFSDYCKRGGINPNMSDVEFGRATKRCIPAVRKTRVKVANDPITGTSYPPGYIFPSIAECRAALSHFTGIMTAPSTLLVAHSAATPSLPNPDSQDDAEMLMNAFPISEYLDAQAEGQQVLTRPALAHQQEILDIETA